jgi:thioredoxin-like negative regulator of GroEL
MPEVLLSKVNVDDLPDIASRYGVEAMPTLAVFYDGEMLVKQAGARPKEGMKELLVSALEKKGVTLQERSADSAPPQS